MRVNVLMLRNGPFEEGMPYFDLGEEVREKMMP